MIKRTFNDKNYCQNFKTKKIFLEMYSFSNFHDENRDEDRKENPIKTN